MSVVNVNFNSVIIRSTFFLIIVIIEVNVYYVCAYE